jgi:hypothetical protein
VSTKSSKQSTPPSPPPSRPPSRPRSPVAVAGALEMLRSHLVELEAVAHAAEDALQHLPYVPRPPVEPGEEDAAYTDKQLGPGRLQAMVAATSSASRLLLQEVDRLLDSLLDPDRPVYATRPGTGTSRVGEDWNPKLLYAARLGSITEPS